MGLGEHKAVLFGSRTAWFVDGQGSHQVKGKGERETTNKRMNKAEKGSCEEENLDTGFVFWFQSIGWLLPSTHSALPL